MFRHLEGGAYDGQPCICTRECPAVCNGDCGCEACVRGWIDAGMDELIGGDLGNNADRVERSLVYSYSGRVSRPRSVPACASRASDRAACRVRKRDLRMTIQIRRNPTPNTAATASGSPTSGECSRSRHNTKASAADPTMIRKPVIDLA
jgi:hypothetical protein